MINLCTRAKNGWRETDTINLVVHGHTGEIQDGRKDIWKIRYMCNCLSGINRS